MTKSHFQIACQLMKELYRKPITSYRYHQRNILKAIHKLIQPKHLNKTENNFFSHMCTPTQYIISKSSRNLSFTYLLVHIQP